MNGMQMLSDIPLRKTWFADAVAMQKADGYGNVWYSKPDEGGDILSDIRDAADAAVVYGNAIHEAEGLDNELLRDVLWDDFSEAFVAYLAMLWELALPEEHGGSKDIDHIEIHGVVDDEQLGLDNRTQDAWRRLTKEFVEDRAQGRKGLAPIEALTEEQAALIAACGQWWEHMWEEIEDMKERG